MQRDAETIFRECILQKPEFCNRCFKKAVNSQYRDAKQVGPEACGSDCGTLGVNLSSDPISKKLILRRGKRLYSRINAEGVDIDKDLFYRALLQDGDSGQSPKKIYFEAINYGTGVYDPDDLPDQVQGQQMNNSDSSEPPYLSGPVVEGKLNYEELPSETREHFNLYEPPKGTGVYYIQDQETFRDEFNTSRLSGHSQQNVLEMVLVANKALFRSMSQQDLSNWIDELEESYRDHLLLATLRVYDDPFIDPYKEDQDHPYRRSPFWPVFGKSIAQDILRTIRTNSNHKMSESEIREEMDVPQVPLRSMLEVLNSNDSIRFIDDQPRVWEIDSTH